MLLSGHKENHASPRKSQGDKRSPCPAHQRRGNQADSPLRMHRSAYGMQNRSVVEVPRRGDQAGVAFLHRAKGWAAAYPIPGECGALRGFPPLVEADRKKHPVPRARRDGGGGGNDRLPGRRGRAQERSRKDGMTLLGRRWEESDTHEVSGFLFCISFHFFCVDSWLHRFVYFCNFPFFIDQETIANDSHILAPHELLLAPRIVFFDNFTCLI
jgi:hypothetical protein